MHYRVAQLRCEALVGLLRKNINLFIDTPHVLLMGGIGKQKLKKIGLLSDLRQS